MLPHLLQKLAYDWQPHFASQGVILQPPLAAIQRGGGSGTSRKVSFLVFEREARQPSLVLKMSSNSIHQSLIEQEHQALCKVWDEADYISRIPRPLGLFQHEGTCVLIESYLPGTSMAVILRRRPRIKPALLRKNLDQGRTWLSLLQRATYFDREPFPAQEVAELSLARLAQESVPQAFAGKLRNMAKDWDRLELPLVGKHGDYWPGNLLIDDRSGVGVIDWEDFAVRANPFYDLFSFVTAYALALPWHLGRRFSRLDRFARVFLEDSWLAREMLSCVNQHMDAWSLPRECAPFFYALFLLEMAQPTPNANKNTLPKSQPWLDILHRYAENESHSILNVKNRP